MAIKALMLRQKIDRIEKELKNLKDEEAKMKVREAELEGEIKNNTGGNEEEQRAIEDAVIEFDKAKQEILSKITDLQDDLQNAKNELEKIEASAPPAANPNNNDPNARGLRTQRTGGTNKMNYRHIRELPMQIRAFDSIDHTRAIEILENREVQEFLKQIRSMVQQRGSISGAELLIPVDFLEIIMENEYRYSKLMNRVRVRPVSGQARQTVSGLAPEAVWTEMCGAINELEFNFGQTTVNGFKVSGYAAVCNSAIDDSDIDLAAAVIEMISEALGIAKDKAILYGKGSTYNMPLGIVTRLAQSAEPDGYPATAPAWINLSQTNIIKITASLTGAEFWAQMILAAGKTFSRYARGEKFWAMNSNTYAMLQSKLLTFTAEGGLVTAITDIFPVISGDVDILEFIPDGDIIGGYGDLYLWAQRSGATIEADRSVQFIEDNTVFKGKERADGSPIIAQSFVAININGNSVTTAVQFAADNANNVGVDDITIGSETLSPTFDATVTSYTMEASAASDAVTVDTVNPNANVIIEYNGKAYANGKTITWQEGPLPLTVTVKNGNAQIVYTVTVTKSS